MAVTTVFLRPDYSGEVWPALPHLASGVGDLVELLKKCDVEVCDLSACINVGDLVTALGKAVRERGEGDPLLVYVGGHGIVSSGRHFTALDASPQTDPRSDEAVSAGQIAELVAGRERVVLLVFDSCFSGGGAVDAGSEALRLSLGSVRAGAFGILACCRAYQTTDDGCFVEGLLELMRGGPRDDVHAWGPGDEKIRTGALVGELRAAGIEVFDVLVLGASEVRILPNPQWNASDREDRVDVKARLRRISLGAESHLLEKSAGFIGRTTIRADVASWLAEATSGVFVVTGGPGTGKSALMGLLARQSVADAVATVDRRPALASGTFDLVVHARQKTLEAVRQALAPVLENRARTVLVDALDEAVTGEAPGIAAHIASVSRQHAARFVVGTRPTPVVATGRGGDDLLVRELMPQVVRSVEDDPDTELDIARLVHRELTAPPESPYAGLNRSDVELVASEVAANTGA